MGYTTEDEVFFHDGFADEVLDGNVQVAVEVGSNDFFGELGKQ